MPHVLAIQRTATVKIRRLTTVNSRRPRDMRQSEDPVVNTIQLEIVPVSKLKAIVKRLL